VVGSLVVVVSVPVVPETIVVTGEDVEVVTAVVLPGAGALVPVGLIEVKLVGEIVI